MPKPTIVTRAGKGSALTWTEGDTNLTNLRDATVSIKAGSAGTSVTSDLNGEIVLVAGSNISLSGNNTTKEITITATDTGITGVTLTDDTTTNATRYVLFDDSTSGSQTGFNVASTKLTFNPSTGTLSATTFNGALSGNATTASTLATARAIYGNNFDGSAALTQIIASTYGGTGNGFTKFTGPTTAERTFTLPDASSTIVVQGGALGTPSSGTVTNLTGTASININGTVGATTANTGAFTTVSASTTTTNGAVNATYNPSTSTGAAIQTSGGITQGGAGYFDFLKPTNTTSGATNPNKSFRLNSTGTLEIINSGYSATILSLTDAGALTASSITSSGSLTFKDPREAIYDNGNSGAATITPNAANGSVQKYTLTGNITWNAFGTPVAGQSMTVILVQDGTGGKLLTSTMKWAGGSKTLSTAANSIDIATVYYDGTNYYASLSKGFA